MKELVNVVEELKEHSPGPSSETIKPLPAGEPTNTPADGGGGSEFSLEEYANNVVPILIPVTITMILVVTAVRNISKEFEGSTGSGMTVYSEKSSDSSSTKFLGSLLNAIIIIAVIFVVTVVMVLLYKFRLMKILWAWIMGSTAILLIGFCAYILYLLLDANNLLFDYISWAIIVYNFGVVGMVAIFWHAPRYINQAYLILISAFTAILFSRLPEWTTWTFLVLIAVYDLFAVLVPKGPLRVLLELSQERNETIPALIYNASVYMVETASPQQQPGPLYRTNSNTQPLPETAQTERAERTETTETMEKPRRTEETERSEKIKDHETNKNDGIEWNGQGARPMDSIDLTQPFNEHELEKERDEEEETGKEEEQANIIIEVDSQGKLSPKLERGADVLVDIPLSPLVEHRTQEKPNEEIDTIKPTTDGDSEANKENNNGEEDAEQKPRKHRHHHRHHHHHRSANHEGSAQPTEGATSDPSNSDHRTPHDPSRPHRHRHHHHRHHRSTTQPQKEITESPLPVSLPPPPPDPPAPAQQQEEKRGIKLGLGDFIFYSVLVGRAAMFDITTVFTCFIAVITGLFVTLIILAFIKRPLPALPVSIALGTIFYFLTRVFLVPYIKYLSLHQFFV